MSQYLGDISAYALAVSQGYTGTEEEYAELMASYATVGQTAVTAAQTATTKASEAATSATTATNKATEATTAATTATNKAAEAQADADAAALDASQAMSAASTATTKATEATTAAGTATTAKNDAVSAKTAAETAQEAAETAQEAAEDAAESVSASAAQIATNTSDISDLKEGLSDVSGLTDNLFTFKDGVFNGVTVKRQADGGLKITGTCTGSINCKQNITPFYGNYSLRAESNVSFTAGSLFIYLRNDLGAAINYINLSGTDTKTSSTALSSNPIAMIDLTFISGKTYDCVLYVQLLNESYYKDFISPYTAMDRTLRESLYGFLDYVTPQMYGAVGDGVADDSTAIQNAMNSGKDVYFPEGTYRITRTITIPPSMYKHKIYADGGVIRHNATIVPSVLPAFSNLGAGYTISGLAFSMNDFPDITGYNPENKPYLNMACQSTDDLDITIENCYFTKNMCMIYAKGRNMYIKNNLFYDMNNTGYCIYLDYPEIADGEDDDSVTGFKNNFSGFRGFIIEGNRCHYTKNWLLNTRNTKCRNLKGLVIRDNYLEGAFCVTGYLNNAQVINNTTFQVNHYDWTDERHDACFNLIEMINTTIDGYSCTGSDAYTNSEDETVPEAKFAAFLRVSGAFKNNIVKNILVSNYMYNVIACLADVISNYIDVLIRKTMNTNLPVTLGNECKHNIVSVVINDVTNNPQTGQYIIDWYPRENAEDNYFTVTANYDCVKYPE